MSNGTRLMALVVVVVLAAVGLYYAFLYNPNGTGPNVPVPVNTGLPDGTLTAPAPPAGGLSESRVGTASGEAVRPVTPPPGAFNAPNLNSSNPNGAKTGAGGTPSGGAPSGAGGVGASGASGSSGVGSGGASGHSPSGGPVPMGAQGQGSSGNSGTSGFNGTGGTGAASGNPLGGSGATAPVTEYAIQSGDTFESLARRFLGDGSKSKLIQDANPGVVSTNLQIGQKIRIPSSGASSAPAPTTESHGANTYTVQKGDSLIAIARKVYGSEADWKRILEANSQLLKGNAESLQPGMKLAIPAKR